MTEVGKVLVGVDGSAASRGAVDWTCRFGKLTGWGVEAAMARHHPAVQTEVGVTPESRLVLSHLKEIVSGPACEGIGLRALEVKPLPRWSRRALNPMSICW